MSRYFSKFPKLVYSKDGISTLVTDIITRITTVRGTINNTSLYYEYSIQDGDTPEMIASKYYGDAELHWIVLIFNNIVDPFYDWPMTYSQFIDYLTDKYGSPATAQITTHHYEKIEQSIDGYSGITTTNTYIVDEDTYNSMPAEPTTIITSVGGHTLTVVTSRNLVTDFDYENNLNESKRVIRLIKKDLIPDIRNQFEQLMSV
jgi:hypothetical protein